MWKKDNPDGAAVESETGGPVKRNTEGLMGVKSAMPDASDPQGQAARQVEDKTAPLAGEAAPTISQERNGSIPSAGPVAPTPPGAVPPVRAGWGNPDSGWKQLVDFYGKGGELFWMLLTNLLLTLATLGVYAFWGKTKVRRYLWGKTHVLGQALEYTGTGKELFISFIIVMPILMGGLFAYNYLFYMNMHNPVMVVVLSLFFYVGFILLWQIAAYKALRYRLTRTRWRGIRGNLSGSAFSYGLKGTANLLLAMVTLGIALPWVTARLVRIQLNNVWFGNRPLAFDGPAKELVKSFFIMAGVVLLLLLASGAIVGLTVQDVHTMQQQGADPIMMRGGLLKIFFAYLLIIVGLVICTAYYNATFYRWTFGHMTLGKVKTRSRLTGWEVVKLRCTNLLLVVCTLGIAFPWAEIRTKRLYLQSIDYKGDPELNTLLQDTRPAPSRGEGLLDALDMDIGF